MPRKRFDKNSSQTYRLLYRSQDDPLIHDDEQVLVPTGSKAYGGTASSSRPQSIGSGSQHQGLHISDLEDVVDLDSMRENEGEAAEHGVFFDDTKYDYMQHMRDLGSGDGEAHFIDGMPVTIRKGEAKGKMKLEDALREMDLDGERSQMGDESMVSTQTKERGLERQQDVPDEIAGFQPDMDPRLREILEALDDDAYVDAEDEEDVFGALGVDGRNGELSLDEFEINYDDVDDEGWESDVTEKAVQPKQIELPSGLQAPGKGVDTEDAVLEAALSPDARVPDVETAAAQDGDWLRDFAKFKRDAKSAPPKPDDSIVASAFQDPAASLYTLNGTPLRQKKRKGAQTNPSAYSMTSSSLARTEGQQLLDARFDQVEKMYTLDEDDEVEDTGDSLASGMTGRSKMSQLSSTSFADEGAVRGDFNSMMDGFLGDWNKANPGGKRRGAQGKRGKNGNERFGLEQLDEVRRELGRGRVYGKA